VKKRNGYHHLHDFSAALSIDNCNGIIDDVTIGAPLLPRQNGVCRGGTQSCINGHFSSIYVGVVPNYADREGDLCDGLDNDCDNITDNNLDFHAASLYRGVCASAAALCVNGQWSDPDFYQIPHYNIVDICDGYDNE
jgi:hypothetical protein